MHSPNPTAEDLNDAHAIDELASQHADEHRPVFEDVESRTLMSAADLSGHTLTVTTGDGNDRIFFDLNDDASQLSVSVNGHDAGTFATNTVYSINVDAGDGNNVVMLDPRIGATTTVHTGRGRDIIYTGWGNDFVYSGAGNDIIDTRAGNDHIEAGTGNDKINAGSGNDYVNAGSGNDSISADGGADQILGKKGNDKIYADADDAVDTGIGRNMLSRVAAFGARDDSFTAPNVKSVSFVDADTGKVISALSHLTADADVDMSKLPAHYSIVADVDSSAGCVAFDLVDGGIPYHRDSDGIFSMTADSGSGYKPWQATAGKTYTLNVVANSAPLMAGLNGGVFQIHLAMKAAAVGAGTTPTQTPTPTPAPAADPKAPTIALNILTADPTAGQGFHAEASGTTIPGYQAEDARFEWDFGDPTGRFNNLVGFNSAHVYEKAGTYTMTLTVTAPGGKVSKVSRTVSVKPAAYKTIYVAANGSDSNDGSSQDTAVRSIAHATAIATDNTRILIRRGDTFDTAETAVIDQDNISVGTYGVGAGPVIRYNGPRVMQTLVRIDPTAQNVSIDGLTFTSIYDTDTEQGGMPHAIGNAGHNVTIRNNTFLNVAFGINNNGMPDCVYVLDNDAPSETGLRAYFCWTQGSNFVIAGNHVANSTREHAVRTSSATNVAIVYNDLDNLNRTAEGDATDVSKSTVNIQKGSYVYVAKNDLHDGTVAMGPLGQADGLKDKDARFTHGVFDGNLVENAKIMIWHGASNVTIRDNVIDVDNDACIVVKGWDADFGRGNSDIVVDHNVGVNAGTSGDFFTLDTRADGLVLTNNVYVAPSIKPGGWNTSAVYLTQGAIDSFASINGNVWPTGKNGTAYANGGIMLVGGDYVGATAWNALAQVGTDLSMDVARNGAFDRTTSMLKAA